MIDVLNSDKQKKEYDFFAGFAARELNHGVLERDKKQVFAKEEWLKCGAEKIHGLCIPAEYGGLGLNAGETANALEALAYGCEDGGLLFSLSAQLLSCTLPVYLYGNAEQKQRYLPLLCSGKIIAANAITEKNAGSDVYAMETKASLSDKGYILNGQKHYISNAPNSDIILVYAATDKDKGFFGGISAFLLDDRNGVEITPPIDKMGLRSCLMGNVTLNNVWVPAGNLLAKEGSGATIFSRSMDWERALLSALHVGTMKRILEKSIAYLNTRAIKGESIARYQSNTNRIADMYALLETSRLMVQKAARALDLGAASSVVDASAAKLCASEGLNKMCDLAMLIFGANGYISEMSVERYKRDALASLTYSGTNDIQRNIISKWLVN